LTEMPYHASTLMPKHTALVRKKPSGIVYSARVALKNPMRGSAPNRAAVGMLNPMGGGCGRRVEFTKVIMPTLVVTPSAVVRVISSVPRTFLELREATL